MNFKILPTILFCFVISSMCAQENYNNNQEYFQESELLTNPTIQPPDVAAFQKVNFIPVSNYTGRANISIPLYEIISGDIKVPISLTYNSSGVKVNDIPSCVGSNWSLSAGGSISKIVKGLEDFQGRPGAHQEYGTSGQYVHDYPGGWMRYSDLSFPYPNNTRTADLNDSFPDLFIVNSPGLSTEFVHTRSWDSSVECFTPTIPIGDRAKPFELTGNKNKIVTTIGNYQLDCFGKFGFSNGSTFYDNGDENNNVGITCVENIKITALGGIEYVYGDLDISQYTYDTDTSQSSNPDLWSNLKVEAYKISSIKDLKSNREVRFFYQKYKISYSDPLDNDSYEIGFFDSDQDKSKALWTKYPQLNRLTKIEFDEGSVEFVYLNPRFDYPGDIELNQILIKDKQGIVIKKIRLNYDYLTNSNNSGTATAKRLILDKIYIGDENNHSLPPYEFIYNTEVALPNRGSFGQDFLGYSNGTSIFPNPNPMPQFYFYPDNGINSLLPIVNPEKPFFYLNGNYTLGSNLYYARAGILEKIIYPSGGYSEFEYELNSFKLNEKINEGGGLRIESQKLVDEQGNEQIMDYTYLKPDGSCSGSIVSMPKFAEFTVNNVYNGTLNPSQTLEKFGFKIYRTSREQSELTQSSFVGYSHVRVKNRNEGGYTDYEYSNPDEFPNTLPNTTIFSSNQTNGLRKAEIAISNGLYSFKEDNDILRGKLKTEIAYNSEANPVKKTENHFSYKLLDDFEVCDFMRLCLKDYICYAGQDGSYQGHGYTQEGLIKSERNVLTKTLVTDYFDNGNVVNEKLFTYDLVYPIVNKVEINPTGLNPRKSLIYYPHMPEVQNDPYASWLRAQNRYNEPLLREMFLNNNKVFSEKTQYNLYENLLLPYKKFTSKGSLDFENKIMVTKRDLFGNMVELKNPDGNYGVTIWGYNGKYPIAVIEGELSYDEINAQFLSESNLSISDLINLSNLDYSIATESLLRLHLSYLRNALFAQDKKVIINTYTFRPLVGLLSSTDGRANIIYYKWDNLNRLKMVKDLEGKVLSNNIYFLGENN